MNETEYFLMSTEQIAARQVKESTMDAGGEWYVGGKFISNCEETLSNMYAVYDNGVFIAAVSNREHAAQIVADHRAVGLLMAALEAAMKIVSDRAAGGRMLTTADEADKTWRLCQAAITAARAED